MIIRQNNIVNRWAKWMNWSLRAVSRGAQTRPTRNERRVTPRWRTLWTGTVYQWSQRALKTATDSSSRTRGGSPSFCKCRVVGVETVVRVSMCWWSESEATLLRDVNSMSLGIYVTCMLMRYSYWYGVNVRFHQRNVVSVSVLSFTSITLNLLKWAEICHLKS